MDCFQQLPTAFYDCTTTLPKTSNNSPSIPAWKFAEELHWQPHGYLTKRFDAPYGCVIRHWQPYGYSTKIFDAQHGCVIWRILYKKIPCSQTWVRHSTLTTLLTLYSKCGERNDTTRCNSIGKQKMPHHQWNWMDRQVSNQLIWISTATTKICIWETHWHNNNNNCTRCLTRNHCKHKNVTPPMKTMDTQESTILIWSSTVTTTIHTCGIDTLVKVPNKNHNRTCLIQPLQQQQKCWY